MRYEITLRFKFVETLSINHYNLPLSVKFMCIEIKQRVALICRKKIGLQLEVKFNSYQAHVIAEVRTTKALVQPP